MSKKQMDYANDFKREFHQRIKCLQQSMSIIIPVTEEDRRLMSIGMDMLTAFDEELQDSETIRELSELIDLEELEKKWPDLKKTINQTVNKKVDNARFANRFSEDDF